jgi:NitT/TauT family transport system permease protein
VQPVFWRLFKSLIVIVLIIALWEMLTLAGAATPQVLPGPWSVTQRWFAYLAPAHGYNPAEDGSWLAWLVSGELFADLTASLGRVLLGFLIAAGLALPLGLAMGTSRLCRDLCNPLVQVLRPIPPIAYIPLAILWFGLGDPPAVFLIAMGAFFPILMNTIAGVSQVDGTFIRAARNLGAGSLPMFRRIILPAAMPYILAGARIAMGTAFIVVIVAEMIAVNDGLGYRILEAREYFWSDKVIAGMFTIGLAGLAIDQAMSRLNAVLLHWHRGIGS